MTETERQTVLKSTREWVTNVVIGLDLCPFAGRELSLGRIRFQVSDATSPDILLEHARRELLELEKDDSIGTTLLIHPLVLGDFGAFNQFLDAGDALLAALDLTGVYQIASFHPEYRFAGTAADDAGNYTNRSPAPMLHFLRESDVERAIAGHPDVAGIPVRNVERMDAMGTEALERLRLLHSVRIA